MLSRQVGSRSCPRTKATGADLLVRSGRALRTMYHCTRHRRLVMIGRAAEGLDGSASQQSRSSEAGVEGGVMRGPEVSAEKR